jgi:hypothetical protein
MTTYSTQPANLFRELGPLIVGNALEVEHHLREAGTDLGVPCSQIGELLLGWLVFGRLV